MPEEQFADLRVVQGVHERERASGVLPEEAYLYRGPRISLLPKGHCRPFQVLSQK